jgi:isoquinoline 1-oxidoreductase alpha subunit
MTTFTLRINNQLRTVDVAEDTPLLWVLRDHLSLPGTKYGCGIGLCGACTVHIDGVARQSCMISVSNVGAQSITTIEGLDTAGAHPLQRAWCDLDVPQCGYCQGGQIMAAAALLKRHPAPTDEQIDQAMAGILCRCGTYIRIRTAIKEAAKTIGAGS